MIRLDEVSQKWYGSHAQTSPDRIDKGRARCFTIVIPAEKNLLHKGSTLEKVMGLNVSSRAA